MGAATGRAISPAGCRPGELRPLLLLAPVVAASRMAAGECLRVHQCSHLPSAFRAASDGRSRACDASIPVTAQSEWVRAQAEAVGGAARHSPRVAGPACPRDPAHPGRISGQAVESPVLAWRRSFAAGAPGWCAHLAGSLGTDRGRCARLQRPAPRLARLSRHLIRFMGHETPLRARRTWVTSSS